MKQSYIRPQLSYEYATPVQMLAASSVNVRVSEAEYEGEGRAKEEVFDFTWE